MPFRIPPWQTSQAQAQAEPLPAAEAATGHARVSGRRRRLPLAPSQPPMHTDTPPPTASAGPARTHAALQRQARVPQAIGAALREFGMRWQTLNPQQQEHLRTAATHLPSRPSSRDATQAAIRQRLHPLLSSIQERARLATQTQHVLQVIDPSQLNASVSFTHYDRETIDGPHLDHADQPHFYLEQQFMHACAQHAVNAMVGAPLVSLMQFARTEARRQAAGEVATSTIMGDLLEQGVYHETVRETLQELGMATHLYVHCRVDNEQGMPILDPDQARFLDELKTDRLLLQADRYMENDSTSSHYVAFRRMGDQWVLLDSQRPVAQYGIAPSTYLLRTNGIKHFTAIWPQHALRGQAAAVDGADSGRAAQQEGAGAARQETPAPSRKRKQSAAPAKAPPGARSRQPKTLRPKRNNVRPRPRRGWPRKRKPAG